MIQVVSYAKTPGGVKVVSIRELDPNPPVTATGKLNAMMDIHHGFEGWHQETSVLAELVRESARELALEHSEHCAVELKALRAYEALPFYRKCITSTPKVSEPMTEEQSVERWKEHLREFVSWMRTMNVRRFYSGLLTDKIAACDRLLLDLS